jgi:Y_Y_Y domain
LDEEETVHGRADGTLTALAEDVDGSVWAAEQDPTASQSLHIRNGIITEKFPEEEVHGVVGDPHGGVWVNLRDGISYRKNGIEKFIKIPPGIHIENTSDIVLDHRGGLWSSIGADGILRSDGNKTQILGASNGLPCASHGSLIFDNQGSLWLSLRCGIARIDRSSLQNWIQHPEARVSILLLDRFDGVQVGHTDFHPSVSRGRDGRLWFVNGSMVQMIDPAHLHTNSFPPPVHIEQLIADHKDVAITSAIHLAPLTRDIEIDYTALSFVMPQRVRFRYKLEGHDKEWQDSSTRRSAFYTNRIHRASPIITQLSMTASLYRTWSNCLAGRNAVRKQQCLRSSVSARSPMHSSMAFPSDPYLADYMVRRLMDSLVLISPAVGATNFFIPHESATL